MRLASTRGGPNGKTWSFREALFLGQAPDGGLFVPAAVPRLSPKQLEALKGTSFAARARMLAVHLLGDEIPEATLARVVERAFDFSIPLAPAGPGASAESRAHLLELFHGPTHAFKDVGARFMAQTMAALRSGAANRTTILAATSGDTGGAVAQAFAGVPGTRVVVLYPRGKVSRAQEAQFCTLGGNVVAVAINGVFDDCQRLARQAFGDRNLCADTGLTSANSINAGRLLPQMFYFAHAWAELAGAGHEGDMIFSVPSGNFGNLAAGLMARSAGIPIAGFVAATNANRVVPDYLASGSYEPRPATPTISTAMDVGNPSNFARILHGFGGDLNALREVVSGSAWTDDETRECIRQEWRDRGVAVDPHTAVALLGLRRELARRRGAAGVALATAHAAKFAEVVEPLTGRPVAVPESMERLLDLPRRFVVAEPQLDALRDILASSSSAAARSEHPARSPSDARPPAGKPRRTPPSP